MKIVLAHGTFDLLHYGHVKLFEHAKKLGDFLVVTLTADMYVRKGPGRPVFSQSERAYMVGQIKTVDKVEICYDLTAVPMITKYQPDIYLKGSDYKKQDKHGFLLKEQIAVESFGGKMVLADERLFSSTDLINRIRNESRGRG